MDNTTITGGSVFTLPGRGVYTVPGKVNLGYYIDRSSVTAIQSPNISLTASGKYSISFWMNTATYPEFFTGQSEQYVISKGGADRQFDFVLKTGGAFVFRSWYNKTAYDEAVSSAVIPLCRWVHVAAVVDGDAKTAILYINGVAAATRTLTGKTYTGGVGSTLYFGNVASALSTAKEDLLQFGGVIDEVKLYNDALLTPGFIMAESSLDIKPDLLYRFNQGMNTFDVNKDYMGLNNLSISGCRYVVGKNGPSAISFSAPTDYVRTQNSFSLGQNGSYSAAIWVNPAGFAGTIMHQGMSTNQFSLIMQGSGKVAATVYGSAGSITLETPAIGLRRWSLIVLTVDNAGKTAKLYLNGAMSSTKSITFVPAVADDFLEIGNHRYNVFNGDLDDAAIYKNKVLTQQDIQNLADRKELKKPVTAPIYCENYAQSEHRQFDYEPNFVCEGEITFDSKNRPYIRFDRYVQTLDAGGNWIRLDYTASLKNEYPGWNGNGNYGKQDDGRIIFDAQDWAYMILGTERSNSNEPFKNVDAVLYSTDYCRTWKALPLPGYVWIPNWENSSPNNKLLHPPCVMGLKAITWNDSSPLNELSIHFFRKSGQELLLDKKMSICPRGISAVGHSGHGRQIVSDGNLVHVCFGSRIATADSGTPCYVMTINRTDFSIVTSPVYLGTIGTIIDGHNYPCIDMDSKGYLHFVLCGHHHALKYAKALSPHSAAAWGPVTTVVGTSHSYISYIIDYDDKQHITSRYTGDGYYFRVSHTTLPAGAAAWTKNSHIMSPRRDNYHAHRNKLSMDRKGNLYQTYAYCRAIKAAMSEVRAYQTLFPEAGITVTNQLGGDMVEMLNVPSLEPAMWMLRRGETVWRLATTQDFRDNFITGVTTPAYHAGAPKKQVCVSSVGRYLRITPLDKDYSWRVIDLRGVELFKGKGSVVDASHLKCGMYLLKVGGSVIKFARY